MTSANKANNVSLFRATKHNQIEFIQKLRSDGDVDLDQVFPNASQDTCLTLAAKHGFAECVAALLNSGANPNSADKEGRTALICSAYFGREACVRELLQRRPRVAVNAKDRVGLTAVMAAAGEGREECLKALLEEVSTDFTLADARGWTALMMAAFKGRKKCSKMLLDAGAKAEDGQTEREGMRALHLAASMGHADCARLIAQSSDANGVAELDANGLAALHLAAANGHVEAVESLADSGADVNLAGSKGWTALTLAAREGHADVVQMLKERGANMSQAKEDGWTAVMLAVHFNRRETLEVLLETCADVNAREKKGWTALMIAAQRGNGEIAELLLKFGADAHIGEDWTPMMLAVNRDDPVCLETLLAKESASTKVGDVKRKSDGFTALMLACRRGHRQSASLLLTEEEVFKNAALKDNRGRTALMLAAAAGHAGCAEMLLMTASSEVNLRDDEDRSALSHAVKRGNLEIVKMLVDFGAQVNDEDLKLAAGRDDLLQFLTETKGADDRRVADKSWSNQSLMTKLGCLSKIKYREQVLPHVLSVFSSQSKEDIPQSQKDKDG